jgi:putative membrane protein
VPAGSEAERQRLLAMSRKLLRFMTLIAVPALALGLWLWLGWGFGQGQGWLHAKLAIVVLIIGYHHACARLLRRFEAGAVPHGHVWFRWFNEIPVLFLLGATLLVVLKPF